MFRLIGAHINHFKFSKTGECYKTNIKSSLQLPTFRPSSHLPPHLSEERVHEAFQVITPGWWAQVSMWPNRLLHSSKWKERMCLISLASFSTYSFSNLSSFLLLESSPPSKLIYFPVLLDCFCSAHTVLDNILTFLKCHFMILWPCTEVSQHADHNEHISISKGKGHGRPRC